MTVDDRQPGGSEHIREWAQNRPELGVSREALDAACERLPERDGGSGAGSTVDNEPTSYLAVVDEAIAAATAELRAALEAAQKSIEFGQRQLDQSRATEAELRARVERLTAWVRSRTKADALSDEQIGKAVDQWYIGLPAALDAAEQHHPEMEGK